MKGINIILPLFLSFLILLSSYGNVEKKESINQIGGQPIKTSMEKEKHFHIESNSSWLALKFSCHHEITINELYVNIFSNLTHAKGESDFYLLIDKNFTIYDAGGGGMVYFYSYNDLFVHLNFFFLNFTYDRFLRGNFSAGGKSWDYNITLPPNTYYLICIGTRSKNTHIGIWMNISGNVQFLGKTHGNTTYFYDETAFLGNANLCWINGSIILNGKKDIMINNTLIGWLDIEGGIGITSLKIISPKGDIEKSFIFDFGFKKYENGWGKRRLVFGDDLCGYITGNAKGKWTIEINMLEFPGIREVTPRNTTPNIFFHYGDIIFP